MDAEDDQNEPPAWMTDEAKALWVKMPKARRGSREAILQCFGTWVGEPEELDRLVKEVYEARDADLTSDEASPL